MGIRLSHLWLNTPHPDGDAHLSTKQITQNVISGIVDEVVFDEVNTAAESTMDKEADLMNDYSGWSSSNSISTAEEEELELQAGLISR